MLCVIFWFGHFSTFWYRVMDKYSGSTGIKGIKLRVSCFSGGLNIWAGENKYQGNIQSYLTKILLVIMETSLYIKGVYVLFRSVCVW